MEIKLLMFGEKKYARELTMNKFLASAYSKLLFESFVDISALEMH